MRLRVLDSEMQQAVCDYFNKNSNANVKPEQLIPITRTDGQFDDAVTSVVGYEIETATVELLPVKKRIDMDLGDECNEIKELLGKCTPAALEEFAAFLAGHLISTRLAKEPMRTVLTSDIVGGLGIWAGERRSVR